VILVHKAWHFIAVHSFEIDVDKFSVDIGPCILGIRKNKIHGIKASWEWIEDFNKAEDEN
jgi:hypothetical protein